MTGFEEIDVHNMNEQQMILAVEARLRRAKSGTYRLRVIHGYNRGTVLRDAVYYHFRNHEKVIRIESGSTPGDTVLVLRELY